jgi:HEAT repeat protein
MAKRLLGWLLAAAALGILIGLFVGWGMRHPRWTNRLNDESPAVRAAAVRALARSGQRDRLLGALKDPDPDVRVLAADALGGEGPQGPERAEALGEALGDEHAAVRRQAARSLVLIGHEAWPAVHKALLDTDSRVRAGAVRALNRPRRVMEEIEYWQARKVEILIPILTRLLRDKDPDARRATADVFFEIAGSRAESAYIPALSDENAAVRRAAVRGIGFIIRGELTGPKVSGPLLAALRDKDRKVRAEAAWVLAQIDAAGEDLIAAWLRALEDSDAQVRERAESALAQMGAKAKTTVPGLTALLIHKRREVRRAAAHLLGRQEGEAKAAVSGLKAALRDKDLKVQREAAWALWKIDKQAEPALTLLTAQLRDKKWQDREEAAILFAHMGPAARSAIPALQMAKKDENWRVGEAAKQALKLIQGEP